jgi:hypothetical protein
MSGKQAESAESFWPEQIASKLVRVLTQMANGRIGREPPNAGGV